MSINSTSLLLCEAEPKTTQLPWLNHKGSLTEKLKQQTGDTQLTLLNTQWCLSGWWERFVLELPCQKIYLREILMSSQKQPCWYARTVIPDNCYQLEVSFFDRLKKESLNSLIFDEPKVRRVKFLYYPINKQCIEFHWLPKQNISDKFLWLRLAEFSFLNQASFYMCEIFLKDLGTSL